MRQSLDEAFANLHGQGTGAGEWSREIKTQLCLAGRAPQAAVVCLCFGGRADNGEWLYDLCWLRYGDALD